MGRMARIGLGRQDNTLPGNRTKNGHPHTLPLSDRALSVLKAIPRQERKNVFGSGQGGYGGWSKSKEVIDDTCKVKDWTPMICAALLQHAWPTSAFSRTLSRQL